MIFKLMVLFLLVMLATLGSLRAADAVVLQEGAKAYNGCTSATIGSGVKKKTKPEFLHLRGSKNRMLIRFDLEKAPLKKIVEARLAVFLPSAASQNMMTEIMCHEVLAPWNDAANWKEGTPGKAWKAAGGDIDVSRDFKNGRPKGAVDSWELFAKPHKYWSDFKWLTQGIPEGGMWIEFDVTPLVVKWLRDPKTNHGVMLRPTDCLDKRFKSKWSIDIPSPTNPDKAHRPKLTLVPDPGKPVVKIAVIDTMTRVSDYSTNYGYRGPHNRSFTIEMAGNEFEGCQVLVKPLLKPLKQVRIVSADLKGPGGAVIPASEIKWYTERFYRWRANWKTRDKFFRNKLYYNPDPVVEGRPWDIPARLHTPFWVNVHTKPGQKPGLYKGTLKVEADGIEPIPIELNVKVWNYDIPKVWNFHTMGSFGVGRIKNYFGKMTNKMLRDWYDFLLDHRFAPTEQYHEILSPRRDIGYCLERGMSPIYVGSPNDPRIKFEGAKMKSFIARYNYVKKNGWLKRAVIYIGDESKDFGKMRNRCDLIHAYCPGLRCLFGGSTPRKELLGYVDVWDPQIGGGSHYSFANDKTPAMVAETQARGERFYWYVAAGPAYPYMNVQLEDPLIGSRLLFWLSWKYGATGFEYYCYNIWGTPQNQKGRNGKKFPDTPWIADGWKKGWPSNCDGLLYYPGYDGKLASSLRFENLRDGIEDWESCYVLRDWLDALKTKSPKSGLIAEAEKALTVPTSMIKDMVVYTFDPQKIYKQRRLVAETIEKIQKAVTKAEYEQARKTRFDACEKREEDLLAKRHKEALKRLNLTEADVKKAQEEAGVFKP